MSNKLSDHLTFRADGTEVVLEVDGEEHYRTDALTEEGAKAAAQQYTDHLSDNEDGYGDTVEQAARGATISLMFDVGCACAMAHAAEASENLSKHGL